MANAQITQVSEPQLFNADLEKALVGSALIDPDLLDDPKVALVKPGQFYIRRLGWIWKTMLNLSADGKAIDLITVAEYLEKQKKLEELGGPEFLTGLTNLIPSTLHAPDYADSVRQWHSKRQGLAIAAEISKLSYSSNGLDPNELFAQFIGIAESSVSEFEGDDDLQTITAAELVAQPPLKHEWIIPDTVPANGITILAGDVASGKTWLGVDAVLSVTAGNPTWGGRSAQVNRPVLYLANDNRQETVRARLQKLCLGHGLEPPDNLHIHRGHLDLSDVVGVRKLDRLIRQHSVGLVLLDIWANYIEDADLNEAHDMAPIMQALRFLADRHDTAFLLLHWLNKGSGVKTWIQRFSGSVQIPGGCDITFMLTNEKGIRKLKQEKSRDSAIVKPQQFVILDAEGGGVTLAWDEYVGPSGEGASVAEKAADFCFQILEKRAGQTLTTPDLKEEMLKAGMGVGRTRLYEAMEILAAKPSVQRSGGDGRPYAWSVVKEDAEIPFQP